jgi:hypothetical protein
MERLQYAGMTLHPMEPAPLNAYQPAKQEENVHASPLLSPGLPQQVLCRVISAAAAEE